MAYVRGVLITLSLLTFLSGMAFPPLHLVSIPLVLITGFILLVSWMDAAAHRPRKASPPR